MKLAIDLPRRDLLAITAALGGITILAWLYLVSFAGNMSMPMDGMPMQAMMIREWDRGYFLMMFLMWSVMMVGMMIPSVTPTVLIYAAVARKARKQQTPIPPTSAFVLGYIVIWTLFSLAATCAQWALDRAALLSPMMVSSSVWLGGLLLACAGIYQLLPVKDRCLSKCRSPFEFISNNWKKGIFGALRMGLAHGFFCLGCCWVLMLLLFVGGVMNLMWIALITLFVLLEKLLPLGKSGRYVSGGIMIAAGILFVISGTGQ